MAAINLLLPGRYVLKQSKAALAIHAPVVGQSGIYQVYDTVGNTFPAYCDMVSDGGFWILDAQWVAPVTVANQVTFIKGMVKGKPLAGYTNNPTLNPCIPTGKFPANPATEWLLVNSHSAWITMYGAWQRGQLFPNNKASIGAAEAIPVVTPLGNKNLYGPVAGWNGPTPLTTNIGFWTQPGAGGPCGGNGTPGSVRMCPTQDSSYSAHSDFTTTKRYFLRASNAPAR